MASRNTLAIPSSSPHRQFATNILSSSPLPSPSEMFKTKPGIIRAESNAVSVPPSASVSFATASTFLRDAKITTKKPFTTDTNEDAEFDVGEGAKVVKPRAKKVIAKKADEQPKPPKSVKKPKVAPTTDESNPIIQVKKTKTKAPTKSAFFGEVDGESPEALVKKPRAKKVDKETTGESEIVAKKPCAKKVPTKITGEPSDIVVKKPRAKKAEKDNTGESVEALRKKPRAKPVDKETTGEPKAKVVRKSRAKKPIDLSQGLFPESNVTKPASRAKKAKDDPMNAEESLDFGLVEAVKRKTTWTPPAPNSIKMSVTPASVLVLDKDVESAGVGISERSKGFSDLFGSFGFMNAAGSSARSSAGDSVATTTKAQDQAVMRKRKLIELVKAPKDGSTSPTKKAPRKKPRTITERATAAYADEDDSSMETAPLMQYFSLQSTDKAPNDGFKVPGKLRSKSPTKGTKQAPILLSPESAMKQVSNQDFVFGTSSQLAREDSPTLLRDLHQAMQASLEQDDPHDFLDDPFFSPDTKKGNLWNAASRGANGELLDVEMTEATDIVQLSPEFNPTTIEEVDDWLDIDEVVQSEKVIQPEKVVLPDLNLLNQAILPSSPSQQKSRKLPAPKSSQAITSSRVKLANVVSSQEEMPQMPLYTSYSTALLAKEIASYRFKPIKSRDGMILMLERCWVGKHRIALQSLDTNIPKTSSVKSSKPPASSQASPKRPRERPKQDSSRATSPIAKPKLGRPKKDSSTVTSPAAKAKPGRPNNIDTAPSSTLNGEKTQTPKKSRKTKQSLEEISDSDSPLIPSPPRQRVSQSGKPPSPLQLRIEDLTSSPERTSSQTQALLFEHITKAVTIESPSKESNNPTWHEKILLYDPIILEDLAVWLNTGALRKVGWDGEVAPAEVKKWCKSKSICCLWKENLRGGARSRY